MEPTGRTCSQVPPEWKQKQESCKSNALSKALILHPALLSPPHLLFLQVEPNELWLSTTPWLTFGY